MTTEPTADDKRPSDPFVMIPVTVLDSGVSSRAIHTYTSIRRHADNKTGQAWVSRETLAEYLGLARAKNVDDYVKELVGAGLITSQPRWRSKRDSRDWSLEKDATHTKQTSNLYTILDIPAGQEGSFSGDPRGTEKGTPGVPKKGHELDPLNYTPGTSSDTSVVASAAPVDEWLEKWKHGEKTPDARPLHPEWSPNNANRDVAAKRGLDVDDLADTFRTGMNASGEKRTGWGKAFSQYLKDHYAKRDRTTFAEVDAGVVTAAVDQGVELFKAERLVSEPVQVEDPWAQVPVTPAAEVVEVVPWEAVPVAAVVQGPGVGGYSPEVEAKLRKVECTLQTQPRHLTSEERVFAAGLLATGDYPSWVAVEVDDLRDRARAGVAA